MVSSNNLLGKEAFAEYKLSKININPIYGKGGDFSPSYSIFSQKENFVSEFKELAGKLKELCKEYNIIDVNEKIDRFVDRITERKDVFKEESDYFFAGVKRGLENIVYFLTKEKRFAGKGKSKLQRTIDDFYACGAGVYSAISGVSNNLMVEHEDSLISWLFKSRSDLADQVIRDLIVQKKIHNFREGILVHVRAYFRNLTQKKGYNIQLEEIPDGLLSKLKEEMAISKKHEELFFAEFKKRYNFNYIIDSLVNVIYDRAKDVLNKQKDFRDISEAIEPRLNQIGAGFSHVIKFDDEHKSLAVKYESTPVFAIILHLFKEGVFNQGGITNYKEKVEPLLVGLSNYTQNIVDILPKDCLLTIKNLFDFKGENKSNDRELAVRFTSELIELALKNKDDKNLTLFMEELFSDKNTDDVVIQAVKKIVSYDASQDLKDDLIDLILKHKKTNPEKVKNIITSFAESGDENEMGFLSHYAALLNEDEKEGLKSIVRLPKVQQNLSKFLAQTFLFRDKKGAKDNLDIFKELKAGLFKEYELEYDIRISKTSEEINKIRRTGSVKKATVFFHKTNNNKWRCTVLYPNNIYSYIDDFDIPILNSKEDSIKKISFLKKNIDTYVPKVSLTVTVLDQIISSALPLPVEKWSGWFEFIGAFEIIKNDIKNLDELEKVLRRMPRDFAVPFCKAIFKEDSYNVNSFIREIIKDVSGARKFINFFAFRPESRAIVDDNAFKAYFFELYGGRKAQSKKEYSDFHLDAIDLVMKEFFEVVKKEDEVKKILKPLDPVIKIDELVPGQFSKMADFKKFIPVFSNAKLSMEDRIKLLDILLFWWSPDKIDVDVFNILYPVVLNLDDRKIVSSAKAKGGALSKGKFLRKLMHANSNIKIKLNKDAFNSILAFIVDNRSKVADSDRLNLLVDLLKVTGKESFDEESIGKIFTFYKEMKDVYFKVEHNYTGNFSGFFLEFLPKINLSKLAKEQSEEVLKYLLDCENDIFRKICFISGAFKEDENRKDLAERFFAIVAKDNIKINSQIFNKFYLLIASIEDKNVKAYLFGKLLNISDPKLISWDNFDRISSQLEGVDDMTKKRDLLIALLEKIDPQNKSIRIFNKMHKIILSFKSDSDKSSLLSATLKKFKYKEMGARQFKKAFALIKFIEHKKEELLKNLFEKVDLKGSIKEDGFYLELYNYLAEKAPSFIKEDNLPNPSVPKVKSKKHFKLLMPKKGVVQIFTPTKEFAGNIAKYNSTKRTIEPFSYKNCILKIDKVGRCPWLFINPKKNLSASSNQNKILTLIDWQKLKKSKKMISEINELIAKHVNKAYEQKIAIGAKISLHPIDPELEELYKVGRVQGDQWDQVSFLLYLKEDISEEEQKKIAKWFLEFRRDLQDNNIPIADTSLGNEMLWEQGFFILRDSHELSTDEKLYEGIKTRIYEEQNYGWLNYELLKMQSLIWDEKVSEEEKRKYVDDYRMALLVRGHYSGEQEWGKCDLDIIEKLLLLHNWQPSEEVNPDFFIFVKDFFAEKRELLDEESVEKWGEKHVKFSEYENLDVEKIEILTSYRAMKAYKGGYVKFNDLKNLDVEKIKILISDRAMEAYKGGYIKFNDLKKLDVEKIKILISDSAMLAYKCGYRCGRIEFSKLKDFDIEKIKILISESAIWAYAKKYARFHFLKEYSVEKIKVLISDDALNAYEKGRVKCSHLRDYDIEKIKILISNEVFSRSIFRVLFHDRKDSAEEKNKIAEDFSKMDPLLYLLPKKASKDLNIIDKLPIIKYIAAEYLLHCGWVTGGSITGIKFKEDFKKRDFSKDLQKAIDRYKEIDKNAIKTLENFANDIVGIVRLKTKVAGLSEENYFFSHADVIILSYLIKTSIEIGEVRDDLSEISNSETIKNRLAEIYFSTLKKVSASDSVDRFLSSLSDKFFNFICEYEEILNKEDEDKASLTL